jgi:FixJ family two-component response regulator
MTENRQTIGIIDDDESVRRALGRLIRSVGLDAATFASAEEFLEAEEPPLPNCLILDLHLPGLSGLELQDRLTALGRAIPLVFISAFGDDQVRDQALRAGAIAFLDKPFTEEALLAAVSQAVG